MCVHVLPMKHVLLYFLPSLQCRTSWRSLTNSVVSMTLRFVFSCCCCCSCASPSPYPRTPGCSSAGHCRTRRRRSRREKGSSLPRITIACRSWCPTCLRARRTVSATTSSARCSDVWKSTPPNARSGACKPAGTSHGRASRSARRRDSWNQAHLLVDEIATVWHEMHAMENQLWPDSRFCIAPFGSSGSGAKRKVAVDHYSFRFWGNITVCKLPQRPRFGCFPSKTDIQYFVNSHHVNNIRRSLRCVWFFLEVPKSENL